MKRPFAQGEGVDRRVALLALASLCAGPVRAQALAAAGEPVVLTVSGSIVRTNAPGEARFDLPMLAALPQQSFATRTPWYATPRKFTGVRLRDLLAAVGVGAGPAVGTAVATSVATAGRDVRAIALNDYRADIPADDVQRSDVMVAYLLDDEPMRVRDKGPLVVIYPFDSRRELRTAVHYSRAVWQLHRIEVK